VFFCCQKFLRLVRRLGSLISRLSLDGKRFRRVRIGVGIFALVWVSKLAVTVYCEPHLMMRHDSNFLAKFGANANPSRSPGRTQTFSRQPHANLKPGKYALDCDADFFSPLPNALGHAFVGLTFPYLSTGRIHVYKQFGWSRSQVDLPVLNRRFCGCSGGLASSGGFFIQTELRMVSIHFTAGYARKVRCSGYGAIPSGAPPGQMVKGVFRFGSNVSRQVTVSRGALAFDREGSDG